MTTVHRHYPCPTGINIKCQSVDLIVFPLSAHDNSVAIDKYAKAIIGAALEIADIICPVIKGQFAQALI